MLRRAATTLTIAAALGALCISGCNGPTKSGREARSAARDRIDLFNAQLSFDQAKQSFEVGRLDRALRLVEEAIVQYPDRAEYYQLEGQIYFEMHRLERAIESFMTAIEKDPTNPEPHYFAGIVFQRWSDDEQAYEHYSRAAELDAADLHYVLAAAESLLALGELDAARTLLEANMTNFSHNSAVHHLLGQISLMEGDVKEATSRYMQARMLNPEDHMLIEELSRAQYLAGDYQGCYESVRQLQVLQEDPRPDLTLLEARCLALLGRSTEARALYTRLSQEDPSNVDVWVELGTIAWELEDFQRVAQCGARITNLAPDRFEGYMFRGISERYRENLTAAVTALREAVGRSTDSPMPHILLGMTLEERGDSHGALQAYRRALSIDPQSPQANALFQRLSTTDAISAAPTGG
ncbi:MAG: tetratricopeptide repeat protein [Planctomycetota bacterium]|jgi:tetratricopeptide (TPR) repeat protein